MGVYQVPEDLDEVFQSLTRKPYIVNDQADSTELEKADINKRLYTTYNNDVLSNLPSCECGHTVGEHLLGPDGGEGVICEICNEPVRPKIEQDIEPLVWIRAPDGINALINPLFWSLFSSKFSKSGNQLLTWVTDSSYQIQDKQYEPFLELQARMQELGLKRGLNSFEANFDQFMQLFFNLRNYRPRDEDMNDLWRLIHEKRHTIFAKQLPIPNRALLVIEESNVGTWRDPTITGAINAARIMTGIDYGSRKRAQKKNQPLAQKQDSLRQRESKAVKAIALLAEFSEGTYQKTLAQKAGLFRKHAFGSRSNWSFRAVISSITAPHRYDDMEIPWGIGLSVFRIHLYNKLERRGYAPGEAIELLNMHAYKYHPLLDVLLQQLIFEAPDGRIPCVLQRNPSLARASSQALYITKVKTDPNDPTIGMSIKIVKGPNAIIVGQFTSNDELNSIELTGNC